MPIILLAAPIPALAQENIALEVVSDQGTFQVEVGWMTADIGIENTFEIRFIEVETLKEVEDIVYDFSIERNGEEVLTRTGQNSTIQRVTFDEPGSYAILVNNIDGLGEDASFSVQVTPELLPMWALAGAFAMLFALRKRLTR